MKPSRRAFLATTAALPVAAAATALPNAAAAITPPAPEYPFEWWHSYDGETYGESFTSREAALRFLKAEGEGMIAECQRQSFRLDVCGDEILETLYSHNEELIGEGEFIECTPEQERELGNMVTAAVEAWAAKHKIDLGAWTFGVVRNKLTFKELAPT